MVFVPSVGQKCVNYIGSKYIHIVRDLKCFNVDEVLNHRVRKACLRNMGEIVCAPDTETPCYYMKNGFYLFLICL